MRSLSQKAAGNTAVLVAGMAGEAVLQLAFILIAGRELGPAEFGFYGYVLAIVTLAIAVAHFGLPVIAVREIAQRPADEAAIFAAMFRLRAGLGIGLFLLAALAAAAIPMLPPHRIAVMLMFLYLLCLPFDVSPLLDAHNLARWDMPGRLIGRALSVGLLILLWQTAAPLTIVHVAAATAVVMPANVVVGWRIARRLGFKLHLFAATRDVGTLARDGSVVTWSNLMKTVFSQSQTIFVKWLSTDLQTGFFALANRLFTPVVVLKGAIYRVLLPLVSEAGQNRELLTSRLERIFPALALIFIPLAALGIPAVEVLVVPLFGPDYAPAVLPLQILFSHVVLTGFGSMFGTAVLAAGDARTPTVGVTLGCVVSVGLSVVFIPRWGAAGAAAAVWCGEITSISYVTPKFLRVVRPRIAGRLARILAASAAGTAAYFVLVNFGSIAKPAALAVAVIVLTIGMAAIREITMERLRALRALAGFDRIDG